MFHVITLVAFQEKSVKAVKTVRKVTNIPKSRHFSFIKGMLRPIFCIDINTNSDRKSKNYVRFI